MAVPYKDVSLDVKTRVSDLLARMSLEEKVSQLTSAWVYELLSEGDLDAEKTIRVLGSGIGHITRIGGASDVRPGRYIQLANGIQRYLVENTRLGIPAIVHEECCSGLMTRGASLFPQSIGMAATFDEDIMRRMGEAIRRQTRRIGGHHALAPVLDVTRDPRWGRTEETLGEDPYLVAAMGGSYIDGIQGDSWDGRVVATGKHFVGYGMSEGGMNWAPAHLGERELRDVYLFPFESAVRRHGLRSVMNSYGEIDGVACAASARLLTEILRGEWGFDGTVVSDYFAINVLQEYHHVASTKAEAALRAITAGIDVELPTRSCYSQPLIDAVQSGDLDESVVDAACARLLTDKFLLGLFENPYVETTDENINLDSFEDRALAYDAAFKSAVLLQNDTVNAGGASSTRGEAGLDEPLLPLDLDGISRIAVIGPNADSWRNMIGDYAYPCHIETLGNLGDVSDTADSAKPQEKVTLSEDFAHIVTILDGLRDRVGPRAEVVYSEGCDVFSDDRSRHNAAVELAAGADVAVVVMGDRSGLVDGCTSGESRDRVDITLPGTQSELLEQIAATGTPVVLVLVNARPVDLTRAREQASAIMAVWLPGEEGGNVVADVLLGNATPGGKLPMSFPRHVGQIPVFHGHKPSGGRSHWAGRYVETETTPLYPFGFGLSYTTFEISQAIAWPEKLARGERLRVSCTLGNVGNMAGDEVVQLYSRGPRNTITRPVRELRGFARVSLEAGASRSVTFEVPWDMFGFYDEQYRYAVWPGEVTLMLGTSSADILWESSFILEAQQEGFAVPVEARSYFSDVNVE